MFKIRNTNIDPKHYANTLAEISHQPEKWQIAYDNYLKDEKNINNFLNKLIEENNEKVKVIFTGAGTSEFVGNTIVDYLKKNDNFEFESIATTNIVSSPKLYLRNRPTLLVSFARSGNSPESLAAVELANKLVDNIYHLAITCADEGKLAVNLRDKDNAHVLIMPEGTNDKGFAMTSSFTSMVLSALLVFDTLSNEDKEKRVKSIIKASSDILEDEEKINDLVDFDFNRIIYLGSGPLYALTNEARLKILELTAGKVSAMFESSLGFRHGPKSYVDEKTFVVGFISNDPYTRKYDIDILNEVYHDKIANKTLAISNKEIDADFDQYLVNINSEVEDAYLALVYVVIAQLFSVIASVNVGNLTDTPSESGTVNRVVQGVIIHEFED